MTNADGGKDISFHVPSMPGQDYNEQFKKEIEWQAKKLSQQIYPSIGISTGQMLYPPTKRQIRIEAMLEVPGHVTITHLLAGFYKWLSDNGIDITEHEVAELEEAPDGK